MTSGDIAAIGKMSRAYGTLLGCIDALTMTGSVDGKAGGMLLEVMKMAEALWEEGISDLKAGQAPEIAYRDGGLYTTLDGKLDE